MAGKTRPCAVCMRPIEADRVEAYPETRLCVAHAEEIKKYGGEFIRSATVERTSKPGSIKRNYGGVTPTSKRNQEGIDRLRADYLLTQEEHGQ